jgi:hypothetical protein
MLVACRLAGLSALEGHYAGVRARAQFRGGARRAGDEAGLTAYDIGGRSRR